MLQGGEAVAVLQGSVGSVRDEQARQIVCLSNTRQIGMAVQLYIQDYNETFPIFYAYNTQTPSGQRAREL